MRILYLNFDRGIPVLGDKGGSVHVRSMATALSRIGNDVMLLCSRVGSGNVPPQARLIELAPEGERESAAHEAAQLGLPEDALLKPLTARELTILAHDRSLTARALGALTEAQWVPDLVYERHALFHVAGVAIASALNVPRVVEVNAPLAEEHELHRGLALRDEAIRREARSWREANLAVAVSAEVRTHLLATGVAEARVLVAQNGVDTTQFRPDPQSAEAVRRQWNLGDGPVIGFVGSFKAWHGVEAMIDAVARVHSARPDLRLLAVGEGPMLDAARARAVAAGVENATVFTGAVPHAEVPAHVGAMDFTVAPYAPHPGFYFSPLKIVESLATGRPVVAPRLGQIEALVENEVTGLLFEPGNQDQLVAVFQRLLSEPGLCTRLGAQAATRARAACDWTSVAARILDHVPAQVAADARARAVA